MPKMTSAAISKLVMTGRRMKRSVLIVASRRAPPPAEWGLRA